MDRNQISSAQFLEQARKCNLQDDAIMKIEELVSTCAQDGALYHEQEGYELRVLPWQQYNVVYTIHQLSGAILIVGLKPSGPMPPLNRESKSWVRALAKKLLLAGLIAEFKELIKKFPDIDFTLPLIVHAATRSDLTSDRAGYRDPGKEVVNECLGEIDIDDFVLGNITLNDLQMSESELSEGVTSGAINLGAYKQLSTPLGAPSTSSQVCGLTTSQIAALTFAQVAALGTSGNFHGLNVRRGKPRIARWLLPSDATIVISSVESSHELGFLRSEQSSVSMNLTESAYDQLDLSRDAGGIDHAIGGRASTSVSFIGCDLTSLRKASYLVRCEDRMALPSSQSLAYFRNRLHCSEIGILSTLKVKVGSERWKNEYN